MSIKTWLAEFYPVDADAAMGMTNLQAVQHSLRKWIGLRKKNMAAHKCAIAEGYYPKAVTPKSHSKLLAKPYDILRIDSGSCALCVKHSDTWLCRTCPLARARGGVQCDKMSRSERKKADGVGAPWHAWIDDLNPEPMIALLEKAEATLIKASKARRPG